MKSGKKYVREVWTAQPTLDVRTLSGVARIQEGVRLFDSQVIDTDLAGAVADLPAGSHVCLQGLDTPAPDELKNVYLFTVTHESPDQNREVAAMRLGDEADLMAAAVRNYLDTASDAELLRKIQAHIEATRTSFEEFVALGGLSQALQGRG